MRRQFSEQQHDAYVGHLLRDALSGRASAEVLAELGLDLLEEHCVVLVAALDRPAADRLAEQSHFAAAWRSATDRLGSTLPCADLATEVVALLPVGGAPSRRAGEDLVQRAVATVAGEVGGFTCGVSRAARVTGLPTAYDQASRAVEVGRRVHGGGVTSFFDDLGVDRRAFARDVLGPLAGEDPEAEGLRVTLQALLDTNFNVAEAARAQFFHYNTMRYRLAKIERLVGPVSSDARVRLDVAVALRVWG